MDTHLALALALLLATGALGVAVLRRWGAPPGPIEQVAYYALGPDAPGLLRTYGVAPVVVGASVRQQLGGRAAAYRERYRSVVCSPDVEVFAVGEERP